LFRQFPLSPAIMLSQWYLSINHNCTSRGSQWMLIAYPASSVVSVDCVVVARLLEPISKYQICLWPLLCSSGYPPCLLPGCLGVEQPSNEVTKHAVGHVFALFTVWWNSPPTWWHCLKWFILVWTSFHLHLKETEVIVNIKTPQEAFGTEAGGPPVLAADSPKCWQDILCLVELTSSWQWVDWGLGLL
jgi:hypothetical protein